MDNLKDDLFYVEKIHTDLIFLIKHTKYLTKEEFGLEELLLDSIMFRFIQISECIKKLSEPFKAQNKQIPWISIVGLRNRIVHDYGKVDLTVIYNTVKKDIYELESLFSDMLRFR
jgi:uncharacterized protein with HEPN domain